MTNELASKLEALAKWYMKEQEAFVKFNPGDEDILVKRLYHSTAPRFLGLLAILQTEKNIPDDDVRFLLRQFAESLHNISGADIEVKRPFFYEGLDNFLKDIERILYANVSMQRNQKIRQGSESESAQSKEEDLFEFTRP